MNALEAWGVPKKIKAKVINVFDADGNFRSLLDIAKEINAF